jgi:hypothetical protein
MTGAARRRRALVWAALPAMAVAACGDDDGDVDVEAYGGDYTVTMVVGAATSDDRADPALLPAVRTSFTERWVLDCDSDSCVLRRPECGAVLGDLDGLELALPAPGPGEPAEALTGTAEGVRPEPAVEEPDPCDGTPAETWTVRVDVSVAGDVLNGSVIRTPDQLASSVPDAECYGVDLTLGLSGVRE